MRRDWNCPATVSEPRLHCSSHFTARHFTAHRQHFCCARPIPIHKKSPALAGDFCRQVEDVRSWAMRRSRVSNCNDYLKLLRDRQEPSSHFLPVRADFFLIAPQRGVLAPQNAFVLPNSDGEGSRFHHRDRSVHVAPSGFGSVGAVTAFTLCTALVTSPPKATHQNMRRISSSCWIG